MNPVEAMLLIARAKKRKEEYIPVPYSHVKDSALSLIQPVRNQDGEIFTCKVNRLDYIRWLEATHQLFPKRSELLSVLRSSLRK